MVEDMLSSVFGLQRTELAYGPDLGSEEMLSVVWYSEK